jgi:hypothetical protein
LLKARAIDEAVNKTPLIENLLEQLQTFQPNLEAIAARKTTASDAQGPTNLKVEVAAREAPDPLFGPNDVDLRVSPPGCAVGVDQAVQSENPVIEPSCDASVEPPAQTDYSTLDSEGT